MIALRTRYSIILVLLLGWMVFNSFALSRSVYRLPTSDEPIVVSKVRSHTGTYRRQAAFDVSLSSAPAGDVRIAVSSSDPEQGSVSVEELLFTPNNWGDRQKVVIVGSVEGSFNMSQDYTIVLSPAVSDDPDYNGYDADDIAMEGYVFELLPPQREPVLLATIEGVIDRQVRFNGSGSLRYELVSGPSGMEILSHNGSLLWTPDKSQQGSSFPVSIRAVNEGRFASGVRTVDGPLNRTRELELTVTVQPIQTLSTVVDGSDLVVNDRTSALDGVRFRFLDDVPENRTIAVANDAYLLNRDPNTNILSEIFYLPEDYNGRLEVMLPGTLSAGPSTVSRVTVYEMYDRPRHSDDNWSMNSRDRQDLFDGNFYNVFEYPARDYRIPMYVGVRPKGRGRY